jgi:hypothetical protein
MRLKTERREERIREIEQEENRLREKYGMDFEEFYDAVESMREEEIAERAGVDVLEVLEDFNRWIDLDIEKRMLSEST